MAPRKPSGLGQIPHVYSRPILKDRFFWLTLVMLAAWALVLWWLFF